MSDYTRYLEEEMEDGGENADHLGHLMDVLKMFRTRQQSLDKFIQSHGYGGDISDTDKKINFIRDRFRNKHIAPPRSLGQWYEGKPFRRPSAFSLCFAFDLNTEETDELFKRVILDRSFDFRRMDEIIYYYCISHSLDYQAASDLIDKAGNITYKTDPNADIIYTGEIRKQVDDLKNDDELLDFIAENHDQFTVSNYTACEKIRQMWPHVKETALREDQRFRVLYNEGDDKSTSIFYSYKDGKNISDEDVMLFILGLNSDDVHGKGKDRSIKPIVDALGPVVSRNFPDRLSLSQIMSGKNVSYEKVRKMIILLVFYKLQADASNSGKIIEDTGERTTYGIDQTLLGCGYDTLYPGNPYDWLFLYADSQINGLDVFRDIIGDLTVLADTE